MSLTADTQKSDQTATPAGVPAVSEPQVAGREESDRAGIAIQSSKEIDEKQKSEPSSGVFAWFKNFGTRWRRAAIEMTPRFVVNHSSNFIGSMQIVAESLMFQSGGINLVDEANKDKPIHYLLDPPKNIWRGVKGNIEKSKLKFGDGLLSASTYQDLPQKIRKALAELKDFDAATARDSIGKFGEAIKLTNKWSVRSGLAGLTAMSVATILPDKKDTAEETEEMTKLAKNHTLVYVGKRFYQAINPLEWVAHKRQFAGLGMMGAGIFSVVSAFRQVSGKIIGHQKYMFNKWQMIGGMITTLGGSQLMLAVDNDSGWRNFGLTQMMRLFTLPPSIRIRFEGTSIGKEQGAEYYLAAQGVLQAKNVFAASVGGAEKREDGTIVDHSAMRMDAKEKVRSDRILRKSMDRFDSVVPSNQVTAVSGVDRAMPELAQLAEQKQVAATTV